MSKGTAGPRRYHGAFSIEGEDARGFVCDLDDFDARFVVEILADGLAVGLARADLYVEALRAEGRGDGRYGFAILLPPSVLVGDIVLEARIANGGDSIGHPIVADDLPDGAPPTPAGEVSWAGGLRLTGSLADRTSFGVEVRAIVAGQIVARCRAAAWTQRTAGASHAIVPAFDLHCPAWMADGRVRHVDVVAGDGTPLRGTPCFLVAFEDGLASFIDRQANIASETLRARHLEHLLPQSLPFAQFADWSKRFEPPAPEHRARADIGVVLIGEVGAECSTASLEAQVGAACLVACVASRASRVEFDPADLLSFLRQEAAAVELLVFAPSGTRFEPTAVARLAEAMEMFSKARSAYCDLSAEGDAGRAWPVALTAFDRERCLEQGYGSYLFAMRRAVALQALGRGADSLFALFTGQLDDDLTAAEEPVHLPLVLAQRPTLPDASLVPPLRRTAEAHLAARGVVGQVEARGTTGGAAIRVRRAVPAQTLVSIIVPTRNRPRALRRLLASLDAHANRATFELIVVDGDSSDPDAVVLLRHLSGTAVRTLRVAGPFNRARLCNRAAALAGGDLLLFLDDGLEVSQNGWLDRLTERMADADVGAAGAVATWPSGIVESAGLVLGPGLAAVPAFGDRTLGEPGYAGLLEVAHEVSALGAACLMTRRDLFVPQGFDERSFGLRYADVDYCLHLRARGLRLIVTPDLRLERQRQPADEGGARADLEARAARERAILRARWGDIIAADPYYSPWLALDGPPYSALAWPPRDRAARQRHHPPARPVPAGL